MGVGEGGVCVWVCVCVCECDALVSDDELHCTPRCLPPHGVIMSLRVLCPSLSVSARVTTQTA